GIAILLPAHNEELVIERTLEALLALAYPADRLEIVVINDASSDRTGELVEGVIARTENGASRIRLLNIPPGIGGQGKASALNRGIAEVRHDLVAIYDADNIPEPASLMYLARQIQRHPECAAVLGKFRTLNRKANLLTRFINIEGISFQWIVQAGRWMLLRFCSLPGTNYVIRRAAVMGLGGWDEAALTEDAELTLRLYEAGYLVKFIPYAVTWEQEPEHIGTWLR
ncbi:MAG: glycosyltransferase family 2 protein, partial [Longimicrobiales bacterium]